jgi:hypothetical protein
VDELEQNCVHGRSSVSVALDVQVQPNSKSVFS